MSVKHLFWVFLNYYGRVFGRGFMITFHHVLLNMALHGLGFDNVKGTGEKWFIESVLAKKDIKVCLDIGANVGNYSVWLLDHLDCVVYAMEPMPSSFESLQKLSRQMPDKLIPINAAASNEIGVAQIFFTSDFSETATLDARVLRAGVSKSEHTITTTTVDSFVTSKKLGRIDFVKIDTEGYEREVLLGMQNTIAQFRPHYIQFEFNIMHLHRNYTLLSLSELLPNYDLYRLLPHGWTLVDPEKFSTNIYMFSNYVAVLRRTA